MKPETYLRERGTDCYCPYDTETGELITGMTYIRLTHGMTYITQPENVVGEFWYNKQGELQIELYEGAEQ